MTPPIKTLVAAGLILAAAACNRPEDIPNEAVRADREAADDPAVEGKTASKPGGHPARKPLAWKEPSTERTDPRNIPRHRGGSKETS